MSIFHGQGITAIKTNLKRGQNSGETNVGLKIKRELKRGGVGGALHAERPHSKAIEILSREHGVTFSPVDLAQNLSIAKICRGFKKLFEFPIQP